MKILIVSGNFFPLNNPRSFRTTELAKEFCRQGHEVDVYIPKNDYDYQLFFKNTNVKIHFVDIPSNKKTSNSGKKGRISSIINRIFNRIKVTYLAYPTILYYSRLPNLFERPNEYDLIISIAVPHPIHWGMTKALKQNPSLAKVWIADCGDPYMLCKTDTFSNPFYFKWFEKAFCRRADYITIPVEGGKSGYYPEFWDKIRVIPQGFDFSNIKIVERYMPNPVITFSYAGVFIPGIRDPRPILDFLIQTKKDFRFYIYTNQPAIIESYKNQLGEKLIINGYIDREELIYRMSGYDFLLNIENGTSVQTPSKLIDYSLSGRPVLSIYSQNIDKEKFERFLSRNYSDQLTLPHVEDYNIKNVVGRFIDLYKSKL